MAGVKELKTYNCGVPIICGKELHSFTNTDDTHSLFLPGKVLIIHPILDLNTLYIELLIFTKYAFIANYKPLNYSPMSN